MEGRNRIDAIDRIILHKLSLYQSLDLVELWYELGEDDALKERVTREELSSRLESLMVQGLVEQVKKSEGEIHWVWKGS